METIHIRVPIGQTIGIRKIHYSIPSAVRPYCRKKNLPFFETDSANEVNFDNFSTNYSQSDDDFVMPTDTIQSPSKENLLDLTTREKRRLRRLQEREKQRREIEREIQEPLEEVKSLRKNPPKHLDRMKLERMKRKSERKVIQTQDILPIPAVKVEPEDDGPPVESLRLLHRRRANSVKRAAAKRIGGEASPKSAKSLNPSAFRNNGDLIGNGDDAEQVPAVNNSGGGEINATQPLRKRRRSSSVKEGRGAANHIENDVRTRDTQSEAPHRRKHERSNSITDQNNYESKRSQSQPNILQNQVTPLQEKESKPETTEQPTESLRHKRRRSSSARKEDIENNNAQNQTNEQKTNESIIPHDVIAATIEERHKKRRRSSSSKKPNEEPNKTKQTEPPPLQTKPAQSPPPKLELHNELVHDFNKNNSSSTPQKRRRSSSVKKHKFQTQDPLGATSPNGRLTTPKALKYRDGRAQTLDPDDYRDIKTSPLKPHLMERLEKEPRKMRLSADDLFLELLNESEAWLNRSKH